MAGPRFMLCISLYLSSSLTIASVLPRQGDSTVPVSANAGPGWPPASAQPFGNTGEGWHPGDGGHPEGPAGQDPVYQARTIDMPFLRNFKGNAIFYNHTNVPAGTVTGQAPPGSDPSLITQTSRYSWGAKYDDAKQSACGIPSNAYWLSGVAIHPYFLKYAKLERMCMQDLCLSAWRDEQYGAVDMMFKVTDICPPDVCQTPMDIKMDRDKYNSLYAGPSDPIEPTGIQGDKAIYWMFTKCWADGGVQSAYDANNWFTQPKYNNDLQFSLQASADQYHNNQASYPAAGLPTHNIGQQDHYGVDPLTDWAPGDPTPAWQPIAGGGLSN